MNKLTETQEAKQWEMIDRMENGGKTLADLYGNDEAINLIYKKLRYFQKRNDRLILILIQKYEKTRNKTYLHILNKMGVDVDYSLEDYRE